MKCYGAYRAPRHVWLGLSLIAADWLSLVPRTQAAGVRPPPRGAGIRGKCFTLFLEQVLVEFQVSLQSNAEV